MLIKNNNYGTVNVVENDKYQYGVIDNAGKTIVPFGKYGWISGFDHGLARVKSTSGIASINLDTKTIEYAKWGIINENGEEVLSVIFDEIWNFFEKGRSDTKVIIDGDEKRFDLINRKLVEPHRSSYYSGSATSYREEEYGSHYGAYAGSYAQDDMGYSDDVIDDAFEGDPDMYWNIA